MLEYSRIFKRLKNCSGVSERAQIMLLFLTALTAVFEAFLLLFLLPFFELFDQNSVTDTQKQSKAASYVNELFNFIGIKFNLESVAFFLVLLVICREAVAITNQYCLRKVMGKVQKGIQVRLLHSTLETRFLSTLNLGTGKFLEICNTCPKECAAVLQSVVQIFSILITLSSYFIVLLFGAPATALVAAIMSVFSLLCLNYTVKKSRIFGKKIVEIRGNLSQQFFGVYDQLREIKVSNNGSLFFEQLENTIQNLFIVFLRSVKVGLVVRSLLMISLISFSVFVIVQLKKSNSLDLAILSTGLVMVMRLLPLVLNFTRIRQGFVAKVPFLSELENHLRHCSENVETVGGQKIFKGLTSSIEFRDAEFSYPSNQSKVLSNVNAVVNKGETTALVGASGAGKSTFVDCLPLLVELGSGMLWLDGEDINSFSKESIRRHIAYVPQSPKLFDGPLWYNVSPSKFPNYKTVIQDLLCEVGLGKLLASMPLGIETLVGDAGVKLSGGQIQRIALARAIFTEASIFILDEPTSALDAENSNRILNLIRELSAKKGVTVLVISHAWDVISKLDKMIKLESGTAVYQGKPEYKMFAIESSSVKNKS